MSTEYSVSPSLYGRLDAGQLRLLQVHHHGNEAVSCTLRTHSMDDQPDYIAISCTWGPAEEREFVKNSNVTSDACTTHDIDIDGVTVEVVDNLFDLLHQLRRSFDEGILFWIDALCIDQRNDNEKSSQVNQMGHIYSCARSVVVWLGNSNSDIPRVFETINQLGSAFKAEFDAVGHVRRYANIYSRLDNDSLGGLGVEKVTGKEWLALMAFYQRRWFSRVRTVQEVALARCVVVYCGSHEISWERVVDAARLLGETSLGDTLKEIAQRHFRRRDISFPVFLAYHARQLALGSAAQVCSEFSKQEFQIWYNVEGLYSCPAALADHVFSLIKKFSVTDPRDRVFGLLGIMNKLAESSDKHLPASMAADYRETVVEVYTKATSYMLTEIGTLTMLSRKQSPGHTEVQNLPTWVIDFSAPTGLTFISLRMAAEQPDRTWHNACKGKSVGFVVDGRRLRCHCLDYAEVTHIGESWEELVVDCTFEKTSALIIAGLQDGTVAAEQVRRLFRTMVGDRPIAHGGESSPDTLRLGFRQQLLSTARGAVGKGLKCGMKRSETLARMPHQDSLSKIDSSGTVPSCREVEEACEKAGLLECVYDATRSQTNGSQLAQELRPFHINLKTMMVDRRTFLLDNGLIGLGSDDVKPGDRLCILADGGRTPFIIRPAESEEGSWMLIGDAYVRDIMFGEGVDQADADGKTWKEICFV